MVQVVVVVLQEVLVQVVQVEQVEVLVLLVQVVYPISSLQHLLRV